MKKMKERKLRNELMDFIVATKSMKKWQKKKLRDQLIALIVAVIGIVLIVTHIFDMAPVIAIIGGFIWMAGTFAFLDIRNKTYRNKKAR